MGEMHDMNGALDDGEYNPMEGEGDDEPCEVIPFWSDEAYARRAATRDWAEYVPVAISLDVFIDKWLKGMHKDGTLVGTNWDAHNCGEEIEPRELVDALEEQDAAE
jgi:hypothetical protein